MNLESLKKLVSRGESERLEFKKSTGDLKGGMETLCGFLNGKGGRVLFGVTQGGRVLGQDVTDNTLREVAREIAKLDPPATIAQTSVPMEAARQVLVLESTVRSSRPYTYHGRPFRRVGTTTSLMPQAEYERLSWPFGQGRGAHWHLELSKR
jgi:ATP-dependent DNA helicase RecG